MDGIRDLVLDPELLVRAVVSGRRRGEQPPYRRVELRWVDLKGGRHLQIVSYDATQAHTANHLVGAPAAAAVDALLAEAYGNWHVETTTDVHQARLTKKGEWLTTRSRRPESVTADRGHDREKERLLPPDDPVFAALGLADRHGRIKPSRMAKFRQVDDFLRILDAAVTDAISTGRLRKPTAENPLRIVDLGCGNGYLTFGAARHLARRGLPAHLTGVDVKRQSAEHNSAVAAELELAADFVVGTIAEAELTEDPDVVLALHACDTATDEALARALGWNAPLVLAAPCCHHDIAAQLRKDDAVRPHPALLRDGILRERFADTLTDAARALLLRAAGYRVDVVEFVDSAHTPRNTLLRAVRSRSGREQAEAQEEYDALVATWAIRPKLAELMGER